MFVESIKRNDGVVIIRIDSNLETSRPVYPFSFDCGKQETAELLLRHIREELRKSNEDIARNCLNYLEDYEISDLKRELKKWDIRNDCFKE